MSDLERLAKIEARHNSVTSEDRIGPKRHAQYVLLHEDMPWLLARVRELEAQAVRDAKVIEAARAYRIAQRAIASACSPPFDPGVCTDAMVAQDEAEATLDAALAEREE